MGWLLVFLLPLFLLLGKEVASDLGYEQELAVEFLQFLLQLVVLYLWES